MSIEIGQKYIGKNGEVVEVLNVGESYFGEKFSDCMSVVWFSNSAKIDDKHVITERDFLEQYKPYEPVYEFEYRLQYEDGSRGETSHMTEDEFKIRLHESDIKFFQRLDFTKRERK